MSGRDGQSVSASRLFARFVAVGELVALPAENASAAIFRRTPPLFADIFFQRGAFHEALQSAAFPVEARDGGQPIPEGDEARALVREMEARKGKAGG